ncbi:hypothetical protein TNCV_3884971 [Trichonephila clavipes]|nr:hypothetical protein TNCV_3884971 [Trichonephila clavipes]
MFKLRYFPNAWKTAVVIPILKPGKNPKLAESHRPISLLPILSKLAEKIISTRLNDPLENKTSLFRSSTGSVLVSPPPINYFAHLKFQDRRLESNGTMCSKTHPNELSPFFTFHQLHKKTCSPTANSSTPGPKCTIHSQISMSSPGFESSPNGTAVSVANHYTGWATHF